jgi:hypothetical protein
VLEYCSNLGIETYFGLAVTPDAPLSTASVVLESEGQASLTHIDAGIHVTHPGSAPAFAYVSGIRALETVKEYSQRAV